MRGMIAMLGSTVGGGIGWWLGAHVGVMTAFMVSTVGTGVGLYAARRACDTYLP